MEKFNKEYFKVLANQIMFDLSEEETVSLQDDFKEMAKQMEMLDLIDTTQIEPMVFPLDVETSYLRNDNDVHTLSQDDVLANAPESREGQIIVPKVVG